MVSKYAVSPTIDQLTQQCSGSTQQDLRGIRYDAAYSVQLPHDLNCLKGHLIPQSSVKSGAPRFVSRYCSPSQPFTQPEGASIRSITAIEESCPFPEDHTQG